MGVIFKSMLLSIAAMVSWSTCIKISSRLWSTIAEGKQLHGYKVDFFFFFDIDNKFHPVWLTSNFQMFVLQCGPKWQWWQPVCRESVIFGDCCWLCIRCDSRFTNWPHWFSMQQSRWTFGTDFRSKMESLQWIHHRVCFGRLHGKFSFYSILAVLSWQ